MIKNKKWLRKLCNLCLVGVIALTSIAGNTKQAKAYTDEELAYMKSLITDENGDFIDPEEFVTMEEWDAYYAYHGLENDSIMNTTVGEDINGNFVTATNKYQIYGLDERVIQAFYESDSYLYVTQHNKKDVIIYRCVIGGSSAYVIDSMTLVGAGHGINLSQYTYKSEDYFLACAGSSDDYRTISVGRVKYVAGERRAIINIERFTDFGYANKNSRFNFLNPIYSLRRVYTTVSYDKKHIIFWIERMFVDDSDKDNIKIKNKDIMYSVYTLDAINQALDSSRYVSGQYTPVSFYKHWILNNGCEWDMVQLEEDAIKPYNMVQGIALEHSQKMLLVSGCETKGVAPRIISINFSKNTSGYGANSSYNAYGINLSDRSKWSGYQAEVEGVQIIDANTIYVGVTWKRGDSEDDDCSRKSCIYTITRNGTTL